MSAVHQYNGCPIVSAYARMVLRLLPAATEERMLALLRTSGRFDLYKRELLERYITTPLPEERRPGPKTRYLYEETYGVGAHMQVSIEKSFAGVTRLCHFSSPSVMDHFSAFTKQMSDLFEDRLLPTQPKLEFLQALTPPNARLVAHKRGYCIVPLAMCLNVDGARRQNRSILFPSIWALISSAIRVRYTSSYHASPSVATAVIILLYYVFLALLARSASQKSSRALLYILVLLATAQLLGSYQFLLDFLASYFIQTAPYALAALIQVAARVFCVQLASLLRGPTINAADLATARSECLALVVTLSPLSWQPVGLLALKTTLEVKKLHPGREVAMSTKETKKIKNVEKAVKKAVKIVERRAAKPANRAAKSPGRGRSKQPHKKSERFRPAPVQPRAVHGSHDERTQAIVGELSVRKYSAVQRALALTIMDPQRYCARMPVSISMPTAKVCLKTTSDLPGNTTGAAAVGVPDLPTDELCAFKFKDSVLRQLILWYFRVPTLPIYAMKFYINSTSTISASASFALTVNEAQDLNPIYFENSSGTKVHGTKLYLGCAEDATKRYWLMSGSLDNATNNAYMSGVMSAVPANQQIVLRVYRTFNGEPEMRYDQQTLAAGATTWGFYVNTTGHFRVTFTLQGAGATPSTANFTTTVGANLYACSAQYASCFGQRALPSIESRMLTMEEYNIHGADLTLTEAASVTNTNGRAITVQWDAGVPWIGSAKQTFEQLGEVNGALQQAQFAKKGVDAYIKPGGLEDFLFHSEFDFDAAGTLCEASYSIKVQEPYIQHALYVPTAAGQVFSYTAGNALEWTSMDAYTELSGVRVGRNRMLEDVIEDIGQMQNIFDNPDHEKNIGALLGAKAGEILGGLAQQAVMALLA